jgi:hypothetical protein
VKRGTFQGAVPVPYRIDGELDRSAIRAKPRKVLPDDGRWRKLKQQVAEDASLVIKEAAGRIVWLVWLFADNRSPLAAAAVHLWTKYKNHL